MAMTGAEVWRDYVTDGIPATGDNDPKKREIRSWTTWIESIITAWTTNGGMVFTLLSSLQASLNYPPSTMSWVIGDPVADSNGVWRKLGAPGSGSWIRVADLPYSFIVASDVGAGTPNVIQATSALPITSSALVALNVFEANTAGVTVSFNGGTPLAIKTNSGIDVVPGGLKAGMILLGYVSGSTFRLVSDQASAAFQAVIEGLLAQAQAAAAVASGAMTAVIDPQFATKAVAETFSPVVAPDFINLAFYDSLQVPGSGGRYRKSVSGEPTHAGKFSITLANGITVVWYELAETDIVPQMFGVLFNSASDQASKMQAWLNAVGALNVDGYVPRGVIKMNSGISTSAADLKIGCHPKAKFDIGGAPAGTYAITLTGTISTYSNIFAGQAQLGALRIRVALAFAANLALGDVIKIKSADVHDASNTNSLFGELNVVTGLVDAATGYIDVERPLSATYLTTPQVAKITPIRSPEWDGGTIVGAVAEKNNQKGVRVRYAKDFNIRNVSAERIDDRAFWIEDSLDGEIIPGNISDTRPASTGYGVSVIDACQDIIVHHGKFQRVRHAFSTNNQSSNGGIPRRITFADNMVSGGAYAREGSMGPGDAIDTHGAAEEIYVERNTVKGCPGQGCNFECRSGAVRDNKFIDCGNNGVSVHNESDFDGDVIVTGNKVTRCGGKGFYIINGTRGTSAVFTSAIIANNTVDGASAEAFQIGYSTMPNKMIGTVFSGNRARASGGGAVVYLLNQRRMAANGNTIDGAAATIGMRLYDCVSCNIGGNVIGMPNAATVAALLVTGSTAGASTGNTISGNSTVSQTGTSTGEGIRLDGNVQYTNVVGNSTRGAAGISLGSGTGNVQANNIA